MNLSEAQLEQLEWAGLLHDIGKIGIRDAVLLKPEKLTREERILMNEHPAKGEGDPSRMSTSSLLNDRSSVTTTSGTTAPDILIVSSARRFRCWLESCTSQTHSRR